MRKMIIIMGVILCTTTIFAQNPFSEYGFNEVKVITMTNGEYDENHDKTDIVEIGSFRFDTRRNAITEIVDNSSVEDYVAAEIVSRFVSIDPEAERYYSISPYAYCANNPIKFIDPDGRKLVIYSQNPEYRQQVFSQIQTLTDHTLSMNSNGLITISAMNEGNKQLGTSLVGQLVTSGNEHVILDNSSGELYSISFVGTDEKAYNGEGTSSVIMYDAGRNAQVLDMDGQVRSMSPNIVIGHEMLHSSHIDNGTAAKGEADDYLPECSGVNITNEEKNTRQQENILRNEQGVSPLRQVSVPLFFGY